MDLCLRSLGLLWALFAHTAMLTLYSTLRGSQGTPRVAQHPSWEPLVYASPADPTAPDASSEKQYDSSYIPGAGACCDARPFHLWSYTIAQWHCVPGCLSPWNSVLWTVWLPLLWFHLAHGKQLSCFLRPWHHRTSVNTVCESLCQCGGSDATATGILPC